MRASNEYFSGYTTPAQDMNLNPYSKFNPDPFKKAEKPKDILVRPKHGMGGHRAPAKPEAPEPMDIPEVVQPPKEEEKAKVKLSNPKWEAEDVGFNEETPISVEAWIPPEHEAKKKIAFELFAKTPKGPERISQAEGMVEGGKATANIPVFIPQYMDDSGNRMNKVEYNFTAKHSMSDLLKDHKDAVRMVDHLAKRLIDAHILQNTTFGFDKSFLRPRQAKALKEMCARIKDWKGKHPDGKMAVFGHADAVGREEYNKALSERRSRSIFAFLTKDPAVWEELYKQENWGLGAVQDLVRQMGHDPGASDGQDGPKTQAAIKGFQKDRGLAETGRNDAGLREALFKAFMDDCNALDLKKKDFDDISGEPSAGCSEFNRVENTEGASEPNRRVAVFLLKSNKNFPIAYPCKRGDVAPCRAQATRKGDRRTPGFKCLFYDQLVEEVKGGGEPVKLGAVKFFGITDAEIKQYVNMPADEKLPAQGFERLLQVEAENAEDGMEIFWKVAPGAKNGKRNDPLPGVRVKKEDKPADFSKGAVELSSTFQGGKASILLTCGLAGGDEFTVEAGAAKGKPEAKVVVRNWRKLFYEIMAPDFMPFEERAEEDGGKVKDFPAAMLKRLEERGGSVFVEYKLFKSHIFTEAEAPDSSVFTKEQMLLKTGKQAYLLTDHTFKSYPENFDKGMAPRSIGLKLCNRNFYYESFDPNLKDKKVEMKTKAMQILVWEWYKAYYLPKSAENGNDSMKLLTWTAKIDPVKNPKHPAVSGGKARSGVLDQNCITFTSLKEIGIELPSAKPDDPGNLVGASVTADKCPIEIRMQFESPREGLGLAGQGAQTGENLVVYNSDSPECFVDVLLHELGHSMGQTVFGSKKPPKGLPEPKTVSEVDNDYANNGSLGHVYIAHGHSGPHCAYGLTDAQKKMKEYGGQGGTCIMFGENSGSDPSSATTGYCPECSDYIKARDLRDLTAVLE
jgi:outer membrane protein OmpA-like peptidoglycan-associated protein